MQNTRYQRFELLVFDWDGTLFDSTAAITRSIQLAVQDVGGTIPSAEQAAYVIGMALGPALARAAPDVPQEKYPELSQRYRYHYLRQQEQLSLFDGILPLLHQLRERGHKLAIATGKSRQGLNQVLEQEAQLRPLFDATRTADETAGKPHPLMLQELMAELDVPPEGLLMIGDTTHDLYMARNADCASVGVSYGAHDAAGFTACQPLFVADTVAQLQQWLLERA